MLAVQISKMLLYNAFPRILLGDFEIVYFSECNDMQRYLRDISDNDVFDLNRLLSSKGLPGLCTKLINFKENLTQKSDLA